VCVCLIVCDLETSIMGKSRSDVGFCTTEKNVCPGVQFLKLFVMLFHLSSSFFQALDLNGLFSILFTNALFMSCLLYTHVRSCHVLNHHDSVMVML